MPYLRANFSTQKMATSRHLGTLLLQNNAKTNMQFFKMSKKGGLHSLNDQNISRN